MSGPRAVALILLAVLSAGSIFAQSYAGADFSLNRSGLSYGRFVSDDAFWNVSAGVDYGSMVLRQNRDPGVSATFGYNFILKGWRHGGGSSFLYAGPGVTLGYVRDKGQSHGLMGGISGILGYEYRFRVPVSFGVCLVPTVGVHMSESGGGMLMDVYRNGLIWSASPQVSVKYMLGERPGGRRRASSRGGDGDDASRDGNDGADSGHRRAWPLFTFGLEWGYSANVNQAYHHNYTSAVGRVDLKSNFMCLRSYGYIMAHGGINCGRHLNLSLYGGYEGIRDGQAVWPVSIRGTWLFGREPSAPSRWLAFLDGGWAISNSDYNAGAIGRAGAGYRLSLSRSVKLDLMLSYEFAYAETDIFDESGAAVLRDRIRRNDNYFSSINLSLGITL